MDMKKFNEKLEEYTVQTQDLLISDKDLVSLFKNLKKELTFAKTNFTNMLLPFSLRETTHSGLTVIQEDETEEVIQDYETLKGNITNAIRIASTIIRRLRSTTHGEDNGIATFTSDNLRSVIELYEKVASNMKQNATVETNKAFEYVKNAYFGFMMLSRFINTCLREYDIRFPNVNIGRIMGLPDPQYLDIGDDLNVFLTNFTSNINELLPTL